MDCRRDPSPELDRHRLPAAGEATDASATCSPLGLDFLTLQSTRSGCSFGVWEPIPTDFSITDAVAAVAAVAVTTHQHEDLVELDTGTPASLLSAIPVAPANPSP
ncbi:hypothetical protein K438DRAFT_1991157 [Mycena galopus ATCC 62051]|nr:hypothetical protein K438DRAFT_1991157 [Mycena galopus ATCC 62051]